MKEKKLIYMAGVLSTLSSLVQDTRSPSKVVTDYISNMSNMAALAVDVVEAGGVPYVPALAIWLGFYDGSWGEDTYRDISKRFIEACDGVFVGRISKGVEDEIKYAESLGKPIFYSYSELKSFIKEQPAFIKEGTCPR